MTYGMRYGAWMRAVCVAGLGLAGASGCLGDDPSAGGQSAAPINHAPTAGPGLSAVVAVNGTVTLDLLAGATDPDGDALFVAGVDVPASSAFASIGVDGASPAKAHPEREVAPELDAALDALLEPGPGSVLATYEQDLASDETSAVSKSVVSVAVRRLAAERAKGGGDH